MHKSKKPAYIHIQEIILVQTIQQGRLDSNETAWTGG